MICPKCNEPITDKKWVRVDWNDEQSKQVHLGMRTCIGCAITYLHQLEEGQHT